MANMPNFEKKLVAVVNGSLDTGKAMNALSHAMLGFGKGVISDEDAHLNRYDDVDNGAHPNISEMAIVVLQANSDEIRGLRKFAIENNLQFVDFVDTMSAGEYEYEYRLTKGKKDSELEYWCIVLFGKKEIVSKGTGKLKLYRGK
jgi:hypothetical protein